MAPQSVDTSDDFRIGRKATRCFLRENKPAVHLDFEHAAARSAEARLRRGSRLEDQFPRRTGARLVASHAAIFDFDFHQTEPLEFPKTRPQTKTAADIELCFSHRMLSRAEADQRPDGRIVGLF
jgi:hypothetical protein